MGMGNSNCDDIVANLDKLNLPTIDLPVPDKFELHKVLIKGVKATATIKGVSQSFILADIAHEDMMESIKQHGDSDAMQTTAIIAEVLKIIMMSLMQSVIANVTQAGLAIGDSVGATAKEAA